MRELRFIFACVVVCALVTTTLQLVYGQDSVGVWSQNLSNGGRVYAMVINPTNQSILYSAGLDSGVYKSTNAGATWFAVNNGLTYKAIQALAISPSNPNVLYAGTDPAAAGGTNKGVYVTTDGGTSWTRSIASSTWPDSGIQAIVVSPTNPNIAIAAVFDGVAANGVNGLYKTTDGGATWIADTAGIGLNRRFIALGINPLNGNTVYAGTSFMTAPAAQSKIYKSVNGGNTWTDASNGLPQLTTNQDPVRAFSVSTADTSVVLAALFYNDTSGGPYVTTDGGALWVKKYNGLPATTGTLLRSCVIRPGSTKEFYVGLDRSTGTDIGVRRTTDGGNTWTDFNGGTMLNTYAIRALVFKKAGNSTLYSGVASTTPASARGVHEYSWTGPLVLLANPGPTNNGGSPNWAMFLNLIAGPSRITVTNMTTASQAAANASYSVVVFKRSGNALGGPVGSGPGSSTTGWDSLGTVPVTQGPIASGVSLPFAIPNFSINPGETVGVAIRFLSVGPRYFGTGTAPLETYSDGNLTLVTGDVRSNPFNPTGSFFTSRALVGEIHYTVGPAGPTCNTFARTWAATGAFPNLPAATYFQASQWLGDTLFVHAPVTGAGSTTIYKYLLGGGWSTGVPLPGTKVGGTLTKAGNKLYYIGGGVSAINGTGSTEVLEFDPTTQAWTFKAPLSVGQTAHGAVSWGDSIIFVVGGPYTGSGTNLDVQYYRIATNTWGTIAASLPAGQGRRTFACGISGNKIVISGGFNTAFLKSTWVGTINSASSITWAAAPDIPTVYTGLSRPGGVAYGDKFFVINGERAGAGGYYDTTHVFTVSSNSWTHIINGKPYKMSNICNAPAAKCVNDTIRIYVPGGYGSLTGAIPGVETNLFDVINGGSLTGVSEQVAEIPTEFGLSQNYPNPFNPTTTIQYGLASSANVTLKIYNILGQEIMTLVNEQKSPGTFQVVWNGNNSVGNRVASGVYFYSLVARSADNATTYTNIKKMLFLK